MYPRARLAFRREGDAHTASSTQCLSARRTANRTAMAACLARVALLPSDRYIYYKTKFRVAHPQRRRGRRRGRQHSKRGALLAAPHYVYTKRRTTPLLVRWKLLHVAFSFFNLLAVVRKIGMNASGNNQGVCPP